ncbi:hypothetical protein [Candidatus Neptunichlamydia sp. REUL1]|uniref:hypothetical protein n=1 Tax=Candidatus Neptunichlamydia sp. REUL1 TaxID=3064277 RepID=UPI00292E313E|nr:hypothetical protein [Candidatus Neptunochlamydia sp. REUL1]
MKKWLLVFSIIAFSIGCDRPKGFTLKKITSYHAPAPEWEVENSMSQRELASLIGSKCHYLGSGNHTYAFVSDDGEIVIKFFKQKQMRTKTWADSLSIPAKRIFYPTGKIDRRMKERQDSFSSYKLAFEKLPEETGILYLHLNKTDNLNLSLTLIDQNGATLEISLDEMEFLIQKKATLVFQHLKNLYKKGQSKEAEKAIISLFEIVASRSQKGIYDKDLQFFKNFGFVNKQAIEIDIGEFRTNQDPNPTYEELKILSYQIRDFLKMHAPKHLSEVESKIAEQIEQYK